MTDLIVVHSTLSGKKGPEESVRRICETVKAAMGAAIENHKLPIAHVSNLDDVKKTISEIIKSKTPKICVVGGDGFASLFANHFFQLRAAMKNEDYNPDVLFIAGGTGNAIARCTKFKNPVKALRDFVADKYKTVPLPMLEVTFKKHKELAHFVSFGADGEIISIYKAQKRKGFVGYVMAVLKYSFSRKLYNPFSRNDANINLEIKKDGRHIFKGRYEGGGVSSIPYVGYGFRPYPLAENGLAHMRFVIFGAFLMPTMFRFTRWTFLKKPNWLMYDHKLDTPATLDFSFDRGVHVQVSGDNVGKEDAVRVQYSHENTINLVKRVDG